MTTDKDEKMLKELFASCKQDVADDGFTRRVMRCLPDRDLRLSQIWSACCCTLAVVLFVAFDGAGLLLGALRQGVEALAHTDWTQADLGSLAAVVVVALFLVYRKVASMA